jgi:O-antigen/teichoic acid export membrane protein
VSGLEAGGAVANEQEERQPAPRFGIAALAHDAAIYGGARVALKSLAFLLVPLYAHFLTPRDFGILELVLATVLFVDVLIAAGMDGVFMRFYFDRPEAAWRRQIISLYLLIEAVYPALVIGGLVAFSGALADRVVGSAALASLFVIALADRYLTNIVDLAMILCRARRKPVTFAVYSLARGLIHVVFTVLLVAVWHLGVKGILIASLVATSVIFLVTLREYVAELTRRVSVRVAREMVSFAWPGLVAGLAFYVLNLVDRFFIAHYHGLAASGLYGVAFRYSQVVVVGVVAFRTAWAQWHYSWLHTGRHEEMVARAGAYYFFGAGLLAVLVSTWILPVFHVLMPERYWDATPAVAPLALAAVAAGANTLFVTGLQVAKRMRLVPPLAVCGGAIAIGLYFLLIPPFSFVGAAWGSAAALWLLAVLGHAVSNRVYPIPWDWRRIALALAATTGACLAALAIDAWLPIAASLPVRVALMAAFPLVLLAAGFFPREDIERGRAAVRRLAGRRARGPA